jgi:hypothetical protein
MSSQKGEDMATQSRKLFIFEMVALIGVLFLSILGVGITDISAMKSYYYWIGLTVLFSIASIILTWLQGREIEDESLLSALFTQLVHWVGTLIAVLIVFSLLKIGRLNYENAGLVMMLVLGLSIFLNAYHMNWRFALVGFFIMIGTILVAYAEAYIWIVSIIVAVIALIVISLKQKQKS